MQIGTSGSRDKDMKQLTLGSEGQGSRSQAAKVSFGGLTDAPLGMSTFSTFSDLNI